MHPATEIPKVVPGPPRTPSREQDQEQTIVDKQKTQSQTKTLYTKDVHDSISAQRERHLSCLGSYSGLTSWFAPRHKGRPSFGHQYSGRRHKCFRRRVGENGDPNHSPTTTDLTYSPPYQEEELKHFLKYPVPVVK